MRQMSPKTGTTADAPPAEQSRTRRAVLGAVAAAGTAGLAGCTGSFIQVETT
jgi:hypothetical protein